MKAFKFLLILLLATGVAFTGCKKKKSDEEAPKPDTQAQIEAKSKILGKWYIKKVVFYVDGETEPPVPETEFDQTQFLEFKSDLTIIFSYRVKNGTFTYNFDETAKTLITSSPNDKYTIKLLTDTDLVLSKRHDYDPNATGKVKTEEITLAKN